MTLFLGYNVVEPHLIYMRADVQGNILWVEPVTLTGPSMVHDFAATKNYVVFMEIQVRQTLGDQFLLSARRHAGFCWAYCEGALAGSSDGRIPWHLGA